MKSADYSAWAKLYSRARPQYPSALFEYLARLCERRECAWDCATGNGQAAVALANHFPCVVASDPSAKQISHAVQDNSVHYFIASAEKSALKQASVNLVTVAAAVHWFDKDKFSSELQRVVKPGGVAAVWTYHIAHVEGACSDRLWAFYKDMVSPYFSEGARLVDDRYAGIYLPGKAIEPDMFWMEADWNFSEVLEFVRSWSGTQIYMQKNGNDPTEFLKHDLADVFPNEAVRHHLRWPIYIKLSRL